MGLTGPAPSRVPCQPRHAPVVHPPTVQCPSPGLLILGRGRKTSVLPPSWGLMVSSSNTQVLLLIASFSCQATPRASGAPTAPLLQERVTSHQFCPSGIWKIAVARTMPIKTFLSTAWLSFEKKVKKLCKNRGGDISITAAGKCPLWVCNRNAEVSSLVLQDHTHKGCDFFLHPFSQSNNSC